MILFVRHLIALQRLAVLAHVASGRALFVPIQTAVVEIFRLGFAAHPEHKFHIKKISTKLKFTKVNRQTCREWDPRCVPSWPNVHDYRASGTTLRRGTTRTRCNRWTTHRTAETTPILFNHRQNYFIKIVTRVLNNSTNSLNLKWNKWQNLKFF